jgi:mannose-6-phosphate isomerase-like protein (cupin superfamily)
MQSIILTKSEARARHVQTADYSACALAFIDCKKPGSHLKENYSIIGAGVTQSAEQVVNITEPHGFQLGAAVMPEGITNNLHIHYTAEVFLPFSGDWVFRWGDQGKDGEIAGGPGDLVSVPTWIFRGFTATKNAGDKAGWIFTVLGGDDTGGILWQPEIVREAGSFGLFLTKDNMMVDTAKGAAKPTDDQLMPLISEADRAQLRRYSKSEFAQRIVGAQERAWSKSALLCTVLPGHACEIAPGIGYGISQDRNMMPKIANPHGFSVEWLRVAPGQSLAQHCVDAKQVLMVFSGSAELWLNSGDDRVPVRLSPKDTFSVPAGVWRELVNRGDVAIEVAVVTAGDGKKAITWAPSIAQAAKAAGWGVDHSGYLAPLRLLPMSMQR